MFHSFRQKLAGWLMPEARSLSGYDGTGFSSSGFSSQTLAGPGINSRSALSIAAVWSAVNIYANTIGALDFYVSELDDRGARRPAYDHPAYDLVHSRPNHVSTSMRLRQALIGHVLTEGNGYLEIEWDARGRYPRNLHLMEPRDITPCYSEDGAVIYRMQNGEHLESGDVIHIAMFGHDGLRGYCPITMNKDSLAIPIAQRTYQSGLFGNGLGMKGHLEVPGTLNTKQKSQLRDDFNKIHQGPGNSGNMGILDGGMKWVQTSFSPQDAELILGCHYSVEEIARIFNLPQHMLGLLENATFSNIEEQNIQFYQMSLMPFLMAIEQEFNNKIFGPIERTRYSIRHDVSTLLRGNTAAQREQERVDLQTGVRSVNEVRIARGYNPIEDPNADKHFISVNNFAALEDMGKTLPQLAITLDPDEATEQQTTPVKPPDPSPGKPLPAAAEALREMMADHVGRLVRRECGAARKASKKAGFETWVGEYYGSHGQTIERSSGLVCHVASTVLGRSVDPSLLASRIVEESRDRFRGLVVCVPPDELPGAVDRVCLEWESGRAGSIVDALIGSQTP